jgi:antitoxin component YwqK of YwqJK toxin-antitoxin module
MRSLTALSFLLLSLTHFAFSQSTVRIKNKLDNGDKEVFYVLKSNPLIKHGEYRLYSIINDIKIKGYYSMGVRDSVWEEYIIGKYVASRGFYKNDMKQGEWKYYTIRGKLYTAKGQDTHIPTKQGYYLNDTLTGPWFFYDEGELIQQYDFSLDSLIYYKPDAQLKVDYQIISDAETSKYLIQRPPILIGGMTASLQLWSSKNAQALSDASHGQFGDVTFTFSIMIDGTLSDFRVLTGVNAVYDSLVIEHYRKGMHWVPPIADGKLVKCTVRYTDYAGTLVH